MENLRAVIVAGAEYKSEPDRRILASADLLIAADEGGDVLATMNFSPHLLVGDFDSIASQTRDMLQSHGVETIVLPVAKDETDTEAALRLAVERGADDIVLLGALGGPRWDHMVGNLFLLTAPWLAGRKVRLLDEYHEVFLAPVLPDEAIINGLPGDIVSLLPLVSEAKNVSTEGLLYALDGATLLQSSTLGVSNELTESRACVTHEEGHLLIIHYMERASIHKYCT